MKNYWDFGLCKKYHEKRSLGEQVLACTGWLSDWQERYAQGEHKPRNGCIHTAEPHIVLGKQWSRGDAQKDSTYQRQQDFCPTALGAAFPSGVFSHQPS